MTEADVIQVERRIAAQPAAVFRYLTESDLWARWQGESTELDPTPGGRFVVRMAEGQVVEGEFVTVEPDRRVVVSWGWQDHPRMPPGTLDGRVRTDARRRRDPGPTHPPRPAARGRADPSSRLGCVPAAPRDRCHRRRTRPEPDLSAYASPRRARRIWSAWSCEWPA